MSIPSLQKIAFTSVTSAMCFVLFGCPTPPPQYSVTVSTQGSGQVELQPPGAVYDEGTLVTLTATPDDDWDFTEWTGDLDETSNPLDIIVDSNLELTAVFSSDGGEGEVIPGEMVSVPAGSFDMGDPWNEGASDELPVHTVTLSAYEIGKYEVTNQEVCDVYNWANTQGYLTTASSTTAQAYGEELLDLDSEDCQISYTGGEFVVDSRDGYSMADHPVVQISWYGAAAYCNWFSESEGLTPCYDTGTWDCNFQANGYHLPTEAQWERAAAWDAESGYHYRFSNESDRFSTDTVNSNSSNPLGLSDQPYTSPVGYYDGETSPVGCYDMSGNVREWINDWYDSDYYTNSPATDPTAPPSTSSSYRCMRSGAWSNYPFECRSASRDYMSPGHRRNSCGFRVARTP